MTTAMTCSEFISAIRYKSGFRSFWIVSARSEVVGAFVGLEDIDELADQVQ